MKKTNQLILQRSKSLFICKLVLCTLLISGLGQQSQATPQKDPEVFTYKELTELYDQDPPTAELQKKLEHLLNTPFVNNEASDQGLKPLKPYSSKLGNFLRVVTWNIERGMEFNAIKWAFVDSKKFSALNKKKYPPTNKARTNILAHIAMMKKADVIVLNEVDWGMKRTEYRNVVKELATALNMNYAYGVEFVEIDPIALGIEKFDEVEEPNREEFIKNLKVDTTQYKGLHGTAILSRYRLENVRLKPFLCQGHDWYSDEKNSISPLEKGKRLASNQIFLEKVRREVRRGGRMMLLADIIDPAIPTGQATIVATHLEARTIPENRAKQLEELLVNIKSINHPVILTGDMNTSTKDTTPTSIWREVKNRFGSEEFWFNQGFKYITGVGLLMDTVVGGLKLSRTQTDPTVRNIRFISTNPEAQFFNILEEFRFDDGGVFDFRGEVNRSSNKRIGTLANSNERASKGFTTTYQVARTIGPIGKFKLDWIFVKPFQLTQPRNGKQSHRFAPHFGRTLVDLNYSIDDGISDHSPIMADLPFGKSRISTNLH